MRRAREHTTSENIVCAIPIVGRDHRPRGPQPEPTSDLRLPSRRAREAKSGEDLGILQRAEREGEHACAWVILHIHVKRHHASIMELSWSIPLFAGYARFRISWHLCAYGFTLRTRDADRCRLSAQVARRGVHTSRALKRFAVQLKTLAVLSLEMKTYTTSRTALLQSYVWKPEYSAQVRLG